MKRCGGLNFVIRGLIERDANFLIFPKEALDMHPTAATDDGKAKRLFVCAWFRTGEQQADEYPRK
jgi:hypothetical protein